MTPRCTNASKPNGGRCLGKCPIKWSLGRSPGTDPAADQELSGFQGLNAGQQFSICLHHDPPVTQEKGQEKPYVVCVPISDDGDLA
jgi:hypothetical protein